MAAVLIAGEYRHEAIPPSTDRLVTAGAEVATAVEGSIHIAFPGNPETVAEQAGWESVDTCHVPDVDSTLTPDRYRAFLADRWTALAPRALVVPHTADGLEYGPAVAATVNAPIVPNGYDILASNGGIRARRRVFGDMLVSTVAVDGTPFVLTTPPSEWAPTPRVGRPAVARHEPEFPAENLTQRRLGYARTGAGDIDLAAAARIVCVGRGIEAETNLDLIRELCSALDASLACTRPLVNEGWLPRGRQVGKTGATVSPRLYLAVGVRGAIEHVVGMRGSHTIAAINTDPDAPIFGVADYAVVGDLFDIVPELINELNS